MPVSFDILRVGCEYDRPFLAKKWGYKGWSAIGRGVVTPAGENVIVLFITREKQQALPQYQDTFDGNTLRMEGEDQHGSDDRLVNAATNRDDVHLFYREKHHSSFVYHGKMLLESYELSAHQPSRFIFQRLKSLG
jgi:putative restriction endonuclease